MSDKRRRSTFQYVKDTGNLFTARYGKQMGRSLHIAAAAATAGTFVALSKLIIGILSLSFFACANAFYSFGMIGAKSIAMTGIRKAPEQHKQCRYYFWAGIVLIISSIIYIGYSIHLFYSPIKNYYNMYVAIGIATVTFTEIGLGIRGVYLTRQNHTLLIHAIKMVNLSSALIALVLTQTALLSFTDKETDLLEISKANGIIGILMGTAATVIGSYMIYRVKRLQKQDILNINKKQRC